MHTVLIRPLSAQINSRLTQGSDLYDDLPVLYDRFLQISRAHLVIGHMSHCAQYIDAEAAPNQAEEIHVN